jgi:deoxyribonuclease-1-like protein
MRSARIYILCSLLIVLLGTIVVTYLSTVARGAQASNKLTEVAISTGTHCPYRFVSWNLREMSTRKSDAALTLMTEILKDAHIVAVQEVVAGRGMGARQIGLLETRLDRTGAEWDSITSDPTSSSPGSTERYAYLVRRPFVMNRDQARLAKELDVAIEREPYLLEVTLNSRSLLLINLHAVPTRKDPLREVISLSSETQLQTRSAAILAGDFNLSSRSTDPHFNEIGFSGHIDEKTSLGRSINSRGEYRRNQYDNIYTKGTIVVCSSGVIDFVPRFGNPVTTPSLIRARNEISDHLPVFVTFGFTE